MPERAKQIWERIRAFFKNMKKGVKIGLIAGGAAIIALIVTLSVLSSTRPYSILFGGLSTEDMQIVVTALSNAGVTDYKIRNNDTILVRENQADRLRALVIQQGYPTTGYNYDTYFNHISALSSQADREQLVLFQLQERLASTIKWFDGVTDARVTITPGEDHRYILDESTMEAKASVMVQMQTGKALTSDLVASIRLLVANAEQGLTIENVSITDNTGARYTTDSTGAAADLDDTMKRKLALEAKINEDRRNKIMTVLVPIVGLENVEVSVNSTVDVTHSYSELLQYFEPDWAADGSTEGRGIIGAQVWDNQLVRSGDATAGGTVGTATNSEINEYVVNEDTVRGDETEIIRSGEITYDVSHQTTQTEHPAGTITDITVAIAINSTLVPLQDPGKLVHMAAMAAGITAENEAEKIAIVSYPFYQSNNGSGAADVSTIFGMPAWAVYAAIAGFALFMALLLIFLLLRSKKKKRIAILLAQEEEAAAAAAAAEAAAAAALAEQEGADIMEVHTEESMKMRQDVRQFVEENPAIAAQMIKNWLRGGEEV